MKMLIDQHFFHYHASVPWPSLEQDSQIDWIAGVEQLQDWLQFNIGRRPSLWAWHDGRSCYNMGVAFKWEKDRTLFLLKWA